MSIEFFKDWVQPNFRARVFVDPSLPLWDLKVCEYLYCGEYDLLGFTHNPCSHFLGQLVETVALLFRNVFPLSPIVINIDSPFLFLIFYFPLLCSSLSYMVDKWPLTYIIRQHSLKCYIIGGGQKKICIFGFFFLKKTWKIWLKN